MKAIYILLIATILITTSFVPTIYSGNGEMAVIINAENPVTAMTSSQVKLIYLRKINKRWKELNKNILPVDRKGESEIRKSFLKEILQMTSDELTRYFTEREYQNAEAPPVKFATDNEIVDYVENNIGAIGFVNKNSIKPGSKVKIVLNL
jgi:ABC-type phosphate transport system substrate-binding protein